MESKTKDHLKNKRKTTSDRQANDGKAPKKLKTENGQMAYMDVAVFDRRMSEVVKRAVKIYHNLNDKVSDENECIAYLSILKKVCNINDWLNRRIFSKIQATCFVEKDTLSSSDFRKFQEYSNNWINHKVLKSPGKTRALKCEAVSNYYKEFISTYGVKLDTIETKINHCRRVSKDFKSNERLDDTINYEQMQEEPFGRCRLCGCKESRLVMSLNEKCRGSVLKDLVEIYCRYD